MQVIEELEELMQDSSDVEVEHRPSRSGVSTIRRAASGPGFEKGECESSWTVETSRLQFYSSLRSPFCVGIINPQLSKQISASSRGEESEHRQAQSAPGGDGDGHQEVL